MCGIFLCLINKNLDICKIEKNFLERIKRRGPDYQENFNFNFNETFNFELLSSVLDLRGDTLIKQPIILDNNDFFQWNGEIYQMVNDNEFNNSNENDGLYLANKLKNLNNENDILNLFKQLKGEYSFTYWNFRTKTLFFGRDYFGRRSLCWNIEFKNETNVFDLNNFKNNFCISSLANFDQKEYLNWEEVPANGIFKICLDQKNEYFNKIKLLNWKIDSENMIKCPIYKEFNFSISNDPLDYDYETKFLDLLKNSIKLRTEKLKKKCKNCKNTLNNCNHSYLAILFSGGIDSTVIALIANEFVPENFSIDLINLSFTDEAPDRKTGWSSYIELKNLAPKRQWNFVAINISLEELVSYRKKHIKNLIYPLKTVLDDSIGCAIWFAARGKGNLILSDYTSKEYNVNLLNGCSLYESPAVALLLGMGADEQLAGYSRHRTTFKHFGLESLQSELDSDIKRISSRNLGRDDRMVSDHGREARYPFLDENFVNFLNELPINLKCDLNLPKGQGDKLILRKLAKKLGLFDCSKFEKRAIQFGSRIATLESKKETANDMCSRLD